MVGTSNHFRLKLLRENGRTRIGSFIHRQYDNQPNQITVQFDCLLFFFPQKGIIFNYCNRYRNRNAIANRRERNRNIVHQSVAEVTHLEFPKPLNTNQTIKWKSNTKEMLSRLGSISKFSLYNILSISNLFRAKSVLFRPNLAIRLFGHGNNILENETFMSTYYDATPVPKESELDPEEFRTRMESWYKSLLISSSLGHRLRCIRVWRCERTEIGLPFTKI